MLTVEGKTSRVLVIFKKLITDITDGFNTKK